ncbi:MAG: ABC transporter transmembrane domain-containing protein, partial [Bacteroidota bacterium]
MFNNQYPFFRQKNLRDCGIASLRMVAAYHGRPVAVNWLRQVTKIDKTGTTFAALKAAGEELGLVGEGVVITNLRQLRQASKHGPCILFVDGKHFLVYYRQRGRRYLVGDPGQGQLRLSAKELRKRFLVQHPTPDTPPSGYALMFRLRPDAPALPPTALVHAPEESFGKRFFRQHGVRLLPFFLVILLGILATSALQYVSPYLTKVLVDLGIGSGDLDFVKYLLIGQLVIVISKTGFEVLRSWLVLHLSMRINYQLISAFLLKLYRLPLPFFETRRFGDILQRIRDHKRIEFFITRNSLSILVAGISVLLYGFILYQFHALFFWIFFVAATMYLLWTTFFLRARKDIDAARFEYAANDQSILIQTIGGMHDLKINNSQQYFFGKWRENQLATFKNNFRFLGVNQLQDTGAMLIVELSQLLILFLSASLIVSNEITLGTLLSIQFITGQLIAPMEQLVQGIIRGQEALISLGRITEFWTERDESTYYAKVLPEVSPEADIRLNDLSFSHPGS